MSRTKLHESIQMKVVHKADELPQGTLCVCFSNLDSSDVWMVYALIDIIYT
jgi:hypothetical protein